MAGYTPLFSTLTTGTLCGKWPDIGLWPIILSMADRNGLVDCTCAYIAGVTGLEVADVTACMARFCEPDPGSRSNEHNGARLVLIDPHRDWGWRVVNHGAYREKARKAASESERIASGANAARMAARRAATREDPTRPAPTRDDRPSDSDADTNKDKSKTAQAGAPRLAKHGATAPKNARAHEWHARELQAAYPPRAGAQRWPEAIRSCVKLVEAGAASWEELIAAARRYRAFLEATDGIGSKYVQQAATFYGRGESWREPWEAPAGPKRMTIAEAQALEDSRNAAS